MTVEQFLEKCIRGEYTDAWEFKRDLRSLGTRKAKKAAQELYNLYCDSLFRPRIEIRFRGWREIFSVAVAGYFSLIPQETFLSWVESLKNPPKGESTEEFIMYSLTPQAAVALLDVACDGDVPPSIRRTASRLLAPFDTAFLTWAREVSEGGEC